MARALGRAECGETEGRIQQSVIEFIPMAVNSIFISQTPLSVNVFSIISPPKTH